VAARASSSQDATQPAASTPLDSNSATMEPSAKQALASQVLRVASAPSTSVAAVQARGSGSQASRMASAIASATGTQHAADALSTAPADETDTAVQAVASQALSSPAVSADGPEAGLLSSAGVSMQEMIDTIGATIEIAARQGIARARIDLQPEELGHISIRLSQTSEGLRARVSADTPAGAQALAQGRSELRQSLSSMGLSLLRLDIGSFSHSQGRSREERSAGQTGRSSTSSANATPEESEALDGLEETSRPTGAPLGEILDVLA
jgi:type III secretion system needle length determinant